MTRISARLKEYNVWLYVGTLCTALLFFNLFFLSENYFGDGLTYAARIESGSLWRLPHPHHLLYNFVGFVFYRLWVFLGYDGRAVTTLQVLNVIVGALGVGIVLFLLEWVTKDRPLAICGALGVAFSYGYWYYSLNPGVDIFSSLFEFCTFLLLLRSTDVASPKWWAYVGITNALAILFHQINLLLFPLVLITLLLSRRWLGEKAKFLASYVVTTAILVGVPYLICSIFILRNPTLGALVGWTVSYAKSGRWWRFEVINLLKDAYALVRIFIGEFLIRRLLIGDNSIGLFFLLGLLLILALIFIAVGIYSIAHWRHPWTKYPRIILLCLVYFLVYAGFFTLWKPGMYRFWIRLLLPIWIVLCLSLLKMRQRYRAVAMSMAILLPLLLFGVNFFGSVLPQSSEENVENLVYTKFIMDYADRDDLLILPYGPGIGKGTLLEYFYGIEPVLLDRALEQPRELEEEINEYLTTGRAVYLISDRVKVSTWTFFKPDREELDIASPEVQEFFSKYDLSLIAIYDGKILAKNSIYKVHLKGN